MTKKNKKELLPKQREELLIVYFNFCVFIILRVKLLSLSYKIVNVNYGRENHFII